MNPIHVIYPRKNLRHLNVVFSHPTEGWALAEFDWRHDEDEAWRPRVGLRWSGTPNELGTPHASGYPTWFLLPEGVGAQAFLAIAADGGEAQTAAAGDSGSAAAGA